MKKKIFGETPVLIFNTGEEDKKACNSVEASGMPCQFIGSISEEHTPMLIWHYQKLIGFQEIDRFIKKWKESK